MRRFLLLFLVWILAGRALVHAQSDPGGIVECEDRELSPSEKAKGPLSIGWPKYPREDYLEGYLEGGKYLSCKLGRPIRVVVVDYEARLDVAERMRRTTPPEDRIDAALITPYVYVLAKELAPIEVFASYRSRGSSTYNSLIVWRKRTCKDVEEQGTDKDVEEQGTCKDVEELFDALLADRTKKLACANRNSTSGFQWPNAWLFREKQKRLEEDVSIDESDGHDKALAKMRDCVSDVVAAAVWDGEFNQLQKQKDFDPEMFCKKALEPPIPHDAFAWGPYMTDEDKPLLRLALLRMDEDPKGKSVLKSSFPDWIDGWVAKDDSSYDGVRAVSEFVSPPLRLQFPDPANHLEESLSKALFGDDGGWFEKPEPGDRVDLVIEVDVTPSDKGMAATVSVIDQRTGELSQSEPVAESIEQLEQMIGRWLKNTFPIRGFLSEVTRPGAPDGAMILRAGNGRGIFAHDTAEIMTPGGDRVPAKFVDVGNKESLIVPLVGKAISAGALDPYDTDYYRFEVFPKVARPLIWTLLLLPILGGLAGGLTKLLAVNALFGQGFGLPGLTESAANLLIGTACGAGLFALLFTLPDSLAIAQKLDLEAGFAPFGVGILGGLIGAVVVGGGWALARRAAHRRDAEPVEMLEVGVFISYRRADTAAYAGRLRDSLRERIDPDRVFMDIESIEAGTDFVVAMERALESSDVMLVLIGKDWLMTGKEGGSPRLADPDDYVGMEIVTGLKSDLRILPVLVAGARMPAPSELPEALADLSRRNALEISDTRWDYDVGRLIDALCESAV